MRFVAVNALLRDRRLSMGREVLAFEQETAALVQRDHAIAVSNGTVALDLAMELIGVEAGDEVLVSALSYIATTNCITGSGSLGWTSGSGRRMPLGRPVVPDE